MKEFIKKLSLFLSLLLAASFLLDLFLSNQLKKDGAYAGGEISVWNSIFEGKVDSDILIYGSSRAWLQIDPQIIEDRLNLPTFNLGIDGHHFDMQYLRHLLLLKYNRTPKVIILSLDVFSLEKQKDLYNLGQFLPYMLLNNRIRSYTKSYRGYSTLDYYVPSFRFSGNISAIFHTLIIPFQSEDQLGRARRLKGFKGMEREWNDDLQNAKAKMVYYEVRFDNSLISLFEKFLIECKAKKINVIFVYTPEHMEGQGFVKNRNQVISLYENFAARYAIPFLDYSDDEICRNKKYFYNASHLNKRGTVIFTNKLVTDLENILPSGARK